MTATPAGPTSAIGVVGCGALGSRIARAISAGAAGPYRVVALVGRPRSASAAALSREIGARCCDSVDELLAERPEYVVEAAGPEALRAFAPACLASGCNVICLSAGALVDDLFRRTVVNAATTGGARLYVLSGAFGGLDVAQAAAAAGELEVTLLNEKPPDGLAGAPGLPADVPRDRASDVFQGSIRAALAGFPHNLNVAAAAALAADALDRASVVVTSCPGLDTNRHTLQLRGAFGSATLVVEATPCAENPRSSALAAFSVLAFLRRVRAPIQFG
jgi:aspartate dehydrogenase